MQHYKHITLFSTNTAHACKNDKYTHENKQKIVNCANEYNANIFLH